MLLNVSECNKKSDIIVLSKTREKHRKYKKISVFLFIICLTDRLLTGII